MFKRILIGAGVLALVVGAVIGIRAYNASRPAGASFDAPQESYPKNSELTKLNGSGLQKVAENESLELYVNFDDGNIEVVNKATGYIWRSCPTDEEMAQDTSNTLWKNNLRSPVVFTYTTHYLSADTKYGNVFSQETRVSVYALDKGARLYFEFLDTGVTFGCDVRIEGDRLSVDIPSELISEPGEIYQVAKSGKEMLDKKQSCVVIDFAVFPSLGATRSDMGNKGYLLVPDGTGALMDFQSDKFINSQYVAHVYGADFALFNGFDVQLRAEMEKAMVDYPIFGICRDGNTLLGIIDKGETQADITASKAGVITGFNMIGARYAYRMKYKVITNITTNVVEKLGENEGYLTYTAEPVRDTRRLLYIFGSGDYVDMAGQYRGYLIEKYNLKPIDPTKSPASLQLFISGGDSSTTTLGKSFIAMTTFEQAAEIARFFKENGIENMDMMFAGWAKDGESFAPPDRFPAAAALGGDQGLTALADEIRQLGYHLFLMDDHVYLGTKRGVSLSHDTVYNVQNNPLFDGAFANARFMLESYENSLLKYQAYGVDGLLETNLGWTLMTDYSRQNPLTREQAKRAQQELMKRIAADFGSVRVDSCREYALMDRMTFTFMTSGSYLTILDETVPFYTIAIHGLVDYITGDYMFFHEPRKQLLETIAMGGIPSFSLTMEPTQKLLYSDWAYYYSSEFALWKEDVLGVYHEVYDYLVKTRGRFIVDYQVLTKDVTLSVYEGGVSVLVNGSKSPYDHMGQRIAAESFIILEGGEGR